jgi:hypothetical protein
MGLLKIIFHSTPPLLRFKSQEALCENTVLSTNVTENILIRRYKWAIKPPKSG